MPLPLPDEILQHCLRADLDVCTMEDTSYAPPDSSQAWLRRQTGRREILMRVDKAFHAASSAIDKDVVVLPSIIESLPAYLKTVGLGRKGKRNAAGPGLHLVRHLVLIEWIEDLYLKCVSPKSVAELARLMTHLPNLARLDITLRHKDEAGTIEPFIAGLFRVHKWPKLERISLVYDLNDEGDDSHDEYDPRDRFQPDWSPAEQQAAILRAAPSLKRLDLPLHGAVFGPSGTVRALDFHEAVNAYDMPALLDGRTDLERLKMRYCVVGPETDFAAKCLDVGILSVERGKLHALEVVEVLVAGRFKILGDHALVLAPRMLALRRLTVHGLFGYGSDHIRGTGETRIGYRESLFALARSAPALRELLVGRDCCATEEDKPEIQAVCDTRGIALTWLDCPNARPLQQNLARAHTRIVVHEC